MTVHITGDGTTTPTRATVTVTNVATPAESRSASVDNLDAACATSCDVVVTVDTQSWQDPGDDPHAVQTMLDNGQATIDATVTADSASGPVSAKAAQVTVNATGRATLMRLYDPNDIQVYKGSGTAYYSIQQPPAAQDHLP